MKSNEHSDQIERYLLDLMSEEEREGFENLMRENPALYEEVQLHKELFGIANDEDFKTIYPHLKAQDEAYHKKKKEFRINYKYPWLIALAIVILIILYIFIRNIIL